MDYETYMKTVNKDHKELSKLFEEIFNPIGSSYRLPKADIIQEDNADVKKNLIDKISKRFNTKKDNEYHDDFEGFTEFEDENGNVLLIRYSDVKYEFLGNTYCKYILCNEKTNSREEGIAQIKNGQEKYVKDPDRVARIKEYMTYILETRKREWCKNREIPISRYDWDKEEYILNNEKAAYIGYSEGTNFHDKIMVYYKIEQKELIAFAECYGDELYLCRLDALDYQENDKYIYFKMLIPSESSMLESSMLESSMLKKSDLVNIKNNNGEGSYELKEFIGF